MMIDIINIAKERIKTFDDACEVLEMDDDTVADYLTVVDITYSEDIIAYAQVRVILKAFGQILNMTDRRQILETLTKPYFYRQFFNIVSKIK